MISAGMAMPNATTFPIRPSGRTCFTGKGRRIAGASISRSTPPEDPEAACRPEAMQARHAGLSSYRPRLRHRRQQSLYRASARREKIPRRPAILAGDAAHVNSPIGAMGMNSGIHDAFNLADKLRHDPARRSRRGRSSTATSASAGMSRSSTPKRRPSATSACWPSRIRRCAGAISMSCAAPPKTRRARAPSCCEPR